MIDFNSEDSSRGSAAPSTRQRLLVFSDDWGRHPSSCQHLVRHLLDHVDVAWMNTIGMRPPRFDVATLQRGFEKLQQWRPWKHKEPRQQLPKLPSPRVLNPLMWPRFEFRWEQSLNCRALDGAAQKLFAGQARDWTILTTIPIVADVVKQWPESRCIYYCVDDFSTWPGLDGLTMARMEQRLVDYADVVVAAGENLAKRVEYMGRESIVITHGVDLEFWQVASPPPPSPLLEGMDRPLFIFWGLIDRRLDVEWLVALNDAIEQGTIVLVGPQQNPEPKLGQITHLRRIGPVDFSLLPSLAAEAAVLIMPYADLPVTQSMQPLKLKEYLATGRPVVARRLPGTATWHDCLDVVDNPDDFVSAVIQRTEEGVSAEQSLARQRLSQEGWRAKAAQLESILFPPIVTTYS
ncbi:MAG: glycosyltransferase [Pirellulales bacterium]